MLTGTTTACADCNRVKICATDRMRPLCYACWHADREKEPCFWLRNVQTSMLLGNNPPSGYTRAEAIARAFDLPLYEVAPGRWDRSGRISHPGYLEERRAAIIAEHPEYGSKG